ncbi:MAG: BatA and WFA domain-containing protein [Planctomycetes bacterium]|nr:BatA and WFA domain-containing protein [Planctomycetota bacterium]
MRFLSPEYIPFALLAALALALYLFRRRPKRIVVSTLPFFKSLAKEHQEAAWLRWLKRILSFLMSAAIILFAVGSLARLVISPPAGEVSTVVILVDRSASMGVELPGGGKRIDENMKIVRNRLAGLPGGVGVMVMAYDRQPEVILPRTHDRREITRALVSITVRPVEGESAAALKQAEVYAALDKPAVIWHVTDSIKHSGKSADDSDVTVPEKGIEISDIIIPANGLANVGISAFSIRPLPLENRRYEIFVQVHGTSPESREATLDMKLDGKLVQLRKFSITSETRERFLIPVEAGEGETVTLQLRMDGDALMTDNSVIARVPSPSPIRLLWVSENKSPFTQLALSSLGEDVTAYAATPSEWPLKDDFDVVIFDGWLPERWPVGGSYIAISPPSSSGPVHALAVKSGGIPLNTLRVTDDSHPILYGVANRRVSLTQTSVLEATGSIQPLWIGSAGPILLAGEQNGQRIVVMGFDPDRSDRLPLMASYPLLIGNAIYWSARPSIEARGIKCMKTGDIIPVGGSAMRWTVLSGNEFKNEDQPLKGRWVSLDRVGIWETEDGKSGSAALFSSTETMLGSDDGAAVPDASAASEVKTGFISGDLRGKLLWGILIILVVECYLFHRKAVY